MESKTIHKTSRKVVMRLTRTKNTRVDDDAMVVFPTADGKLATTWMKNVDNIISEGTGKISVDRLKVMQGKLKTALDLVTHRITEEELSLSEAQANKRKLAKLKDFSNNWVGKVVCLRNRGESPTTLLAMLVCHVDMVTDQKLSIKGLRFSHTEGNCSAISTYSVSVPLEKVTVQDRICFYTIDLGEPYALVIDVGRSSLVDVDVIKSFVKKLGIMVETCSKNHMEENKCKHKVKLKGKSAKPEP
jgi:hypothetical protein